MDDEDILSDRPDSAKHWDNWTCCVCQKLIYNLDKNGKPIEGAPTPHYVSRDYPVVCQLCFVLYSILDRSEYFTKLVKEDKLSAEERARRIKKLRSGEDYLG